jgi:hypothetical protein
MSGAEFFDQLRDRFDGTEDQWARLRGVLEHHDECVLGVVKSQALRDDGTSRSLYVVQITRDGATGTFGASDELDAAIEQAAATPEEDAS